MLNRVEKQLRKEGDALQLEADRLAARDVELSKYRRGFSRKDFSTDSLRWAGVQTLWPVDTLPAVDTLAAPADSLAREGAVELIPIPEQLMPLKTRPSRVNKQIKLNETE